MASITAHEKQVCRQLEEKYGENLSPIEFALKRFKHHTLGKIKDRYANINEWGITDSLTKGAKTSIQGIKTTLTGAALILITLTSPFLAWLYVLLLEIGETRQAWQTYEKYLEEKQ